MKYDDAEHVMKLLEDGYPDMPLEITSMTEGPSGNRSYAVTFSNGGDVSSETVAMLVEKTGRDLRLEGEAEGVIRFVWY